jgi:hypothetical protein
VDALGVPMAAKQPEGLWISSERQQAQSPPANASDEGSKRPVTGSGEDTTIDRC